jgi:hypothetical protein
MKEYREEIVYNSIKNRTHNIKDIMGKYYRPTCINMAQLS